MSNPFVAELRIVGFNFAPTGWALADGQILPLSQNTALFSLLGTTYGGDGKSNFALPNMQGRCSMHQGQGPGLSLHDLGETGGSDTVTLIQSQIPSHSHTVNAVSFPQADQTAAASNVLAETKTGPGNVGNIYSSSGGAQLNPQCVGLAGGNLPHNNLMPYLTLNWVIALQGVYPPRN